MNYARVFAATEGVDVFNARRARLNVTNRCGVCMSAIRMQGIGKDVMLAALWSQKNGMCPHRR